MNEVREARDTYERAMEEAGDALTRAFAKLKLLEAALIEDRYPAWTLKGGQFVLSTDTTYAVVTPVEADVAAYRLEFELELSTPGRPSPSLTYEDRIEWQFSTAEAFAHAGTE